MGKKSGNKKAQPEPEPSQPIAPAAAPSIPDSSSSSSKLRKWIRAHKPLATLAALVGIAGAVTAMIATAEQQKWGPFAESAIEISQEFDNTLPNAANCHTDARTIQSFVVDGLDGGEGGEVELRYSDECKTGWVRVLTPVPEGTVSKTIEREAFKDVPALSITTDDASGVGVPGRYESFSGQLYLPECATIEASMVGADGQLLFSLEPQTVCLREVD